MNKRIDYNVLIEEIKKCGDIVVDQKLAIKLLKDELPKSCFDKNYLMRGRNALGRFLIENADIYETEFISPQIIIKKKQ